jgi:flagellar secretion chaperone FliS
MTHQNAAHSYEMDNARGASAIGGIVALFDTIIRDFQRASVAIAAGNIEIRVRQLNHALTVIAELQGVLDYQRGGIAAKRFERFYEVTRGLIMEANLRGTQESLRELIALYTPVRQAWRTIDQRMPPSEAHSPAPVRASGQSARAEDFATPSSRWDA